MAGFLELSRATATILVGGLLLVLLAHARGQVSDAPRATTHCGEMEGLWKDGAAVFNGIPYAKPPLGERRWRPSEALAKEDGCWQGTLQAKTLGNVCVQDDFSGPGLTKGNEDCLFINIITHNLNHSVDAGLLPVAVWLHGGYLMTGSGGGPPGYTPTPEFASSTGVVSVSLNYRLNALGFLAVSVLDEGAGSGNYGFYDQILALKWVQQNIASFGGDKNRVTVYGQSSGGTSIVALLASPLAKGLFHGVIMMSGSPYTNNTLKDAYTANVRIMLGSGCRTAACLRSLPATTLLSLVDGARYPNWAGGDLLLLPTLGTIVGPMAVIDGVLLPESSLDAVANGHGNDVPVIVGTCAQESDIQAPQGFRQMTWPQYEAIVKKHMDSFQRDPRNAQTNVYGEVSKLYPRNMTAPYGNAGGTCVSGKPDFMMLSMIADARAICPNRLLARHYAKHFKSAVYDYVVVQCPSAGLRSKFGAHYAYHSFDTNALFNFTFAPKPDLHPNGRDLQFASATQKFFKRFAYGMAPDPIWKPVEEGTYLLMGEPIMGGVYHEEKCAFFDSHGFPLYAWQN